MRITMVWKKEWFCPIEMFYFLVRNLKLSSRPQRDAALSVFLYWCTNLQYCHKATKGTTNIHPMGRQQHLAGRGWPSLSRQLVLGSFPLKAMWALDFLLGAVKSYFIQPLLQKRFALRGVCKDGEIAMFPGPNQITFFKAPFPIFWTPGDFCLVSNCYNLWHPLDFQKELGVEQDFFQH